MENNNDGIAPAIQPDPVAPVVTPAAPEPALPTGVKDRTTEQFEKLLDANRRLAEEVATMRTQNAPKAQPAPLTDDMFIVDPATGEKLVDSDKLRAKLSENEGRATRAESLINNYIKSEQDKEIDRQNAEAFAAYPELNASDPKFDANFQKHVRGILQDSMWNVDDYGGKPLSFKAAGDLVRASMPGKAPEPVAPVVDDKAAKAASDAAQAAKEAAAAQASGKNGQVARESITDEDELNNLRYRTRYLSDDAALAERIKHTEHILPKGGA